MHRNLQAAEGALLRLHSQCLYVRYCVISGDGQDEVLENFNNPKVLQKVLKESPGQSSKPSWPKECSRRKVLDLQFRGKE